MGQGWIEMGNWILVYICDDIASKFTPKDISNTERFFLELNFLKKEWVLCCSYNPHSNFIDTHMDSTGKVIDSLSARFENFILIGDFNAEESDTTVKDFCDIYGFKNLIKDATCLKILGKPTCIDLMLRNRNRSFQNSCVIDADLCHLGKMTVTVLRSHLNKLSPKIIQYRDYKNFSKDTFRSELDIENGNLQNFNDFHSLLAKCKNVLNRTAPLKQKHVRANSSPFINKTILQTIMKQTRLKNKFMKYRSERQKRAYSAQRNLCVSLAIKTKKEYFDNLDLRNVADNKKFWKTVKPYLQIKE